MTLDPTTKGTVPDNPAGVIDWEQTLLQNEGWLRAIIATRLQGADRPQAVDDVIQEVALAALKSPPGSIHPAKVGPWLYQVAVRQTLLYRRKSGRQRKLIDNVAQRKIGQPAANDSEQSDPLVWLMRVEHAEQIRAAVNDLHRRDREIIVLKYEQNWSYHQLVEYLGISHSAVEARLHRARMRLRQALVQRQVVENRTS